MSGNHFTDEILLDIFLRLPVKAIGRFRCVNKRLCSLFESPNFIQKHLNQSIEKDKLSILISSYGYRNECLVHSMSSRNDSSFSLSDYQTLEIDYPLKSQKPIVEVIGSCNGLVCLELNRKDVCIWNPCTTEFKKIETPPTEVKHLNLAQSKGMKGYSYGFGYDSKIGDYKLVRYELCEYLFHFHGGSIYTLGTDTWKKIESKSSHYDVCDGKNKSGLQINGHKSGVHVNGVLYWTASPTLEKGDRFKESLVIVSFDVCDESAHEIQLPAYNSVGKVGFGLSVFDGNLCLISSNVFGGPAEVWVMKGSGEDKGKWAKFFNIEKPVNGINYVMLIHSLKTGGILFQLKREGVDVRNGIVLYEPEHKRSTELKIHGPHKLFIVGSYFPSLVSLKSGTFVRAREFKKLQSKMESCTVIEK